MKILASLALLFSIPLFAREVEPTATPVAYVYIQTVKGVDVFAASAAGKMTLVKGSPFPVIGLMEDINGKYLISVGTGYLHTYPIESNGAVGEQASEINTQDYDGSECGLTNGLGSVLDHTGKFLYVQLDTGGNPWCAAWQSYQVESNGSLTFLGSTETFSPIGDVQPSNVPTISSNDEYGYGTILMAPIPEQPPYSSFAPFQKLPDGQLVVNDSFSVTYPGGDAEGGPYIAKADPNGHLAVMMYSVSGPFQLASYTIDNSTGSIVSTNTWQDMPTAGDYVRTMSMSPSGKLLAVGGSPGLQIFHFNGAAPITNYSVLSSTTDIDQVHWDNNNHLYVLSDGLYVYTITPTSISEVPGSPFKVSGEEVALIVVPKEVTP